MYSCCVFLDLSKAFDTVNHKILIRKIKKNFGICGNALKLMKNYLENRRQYTRVLNSTSETLPVKVRITYFRAHV